MASADEIKRDIDQAMRNHEAQVAIRIADSFRGALNMIDAQPAAILEAMIGYVEQLQRAGNVPRHRHKVRAVMIEYLQQRLLEARTRERRLAQAIMGTADHPDDYTPGMS
jgi:hypothetical protein